MGVGFDPSSELRVKKNRKETTIIEVNTIYSPALLNDWGLHMARPSPNEKTKEKGKKERKNRKEKKNHRETPTVRQIQVYVHHPRGGTKGNSTVMVLEGPSPSTHVTWHDDYQLWSSLQESWGVGVGVYLP